MTSRTIATSCMIMVAGFAIGQHAHNHGPHNHYQDHHHTHDHGHKHAGEHAHVASPAPNQARLNYVRNDGQWDPSVRYQAAFPDAKMFLQDDGALWVRLEDGAADRFHDAKHDESVNELDLVFQAHAWKMEFVNANVNARKYGEDKATYYHNYFLGNDPSKWAGGVPLFGEVIYANLWPGVDMRWHGEGANVKYDLLLTPGADPASIAFRYNGLDSPPAIREGNLILTTSVVELREMQPVAWYGDDRTPIECEFVLDGDIVGFRFPNGYDDSRPIVIDPLLMGATYTGCNGSSIYGHCATYDDAGNIYSGGQAFGPGLPASVGAFQATYGGGFGTDINVNKFSPDATTQLFATYLGGNADEKPHSLIVTDNQELTVFGSSTGAGYPTTANALSPTFVGGSSDIVVTRFNAGGTALIGSTYVGGTDADGRQSFNPTGNYGDTFRGEVMLDASDNTFVVSSSSSINFPVSAGAYQGALAGGQDAVVFGLTPDCSALIWSTYLGGTQDENGLGMRFDANGDVYVVGGTESTNFPNIGGGYQNTFQGGSADGYIAYLTNGGTTLSGATYFGTASDDITQFLDLDNNGDIYIYGQTEGTIPISPVGTYGQAGGTIYLAKMDPTLGSALITTTVGPPATFGSSLTPVAFLVDVCDHIYISGYNPNSGWSTTPDALYATGGGSDFYLAAYDVDLAGQLFGTYYGGNHVDGGTSRFDKNGIVYQGVCSSGSTMPTTAGSFSPTQLSSWDVGVFKIDFQVAGVNAAGIGTQNQGCAPIQINFINNSTGNQFLWDFGDGSPTDTAAVPSHTYTTPGSFTVTLIAMDSLSCNLADTITFPITIGQAQPITSAFTATPDPTCATFGVSTVNNSTGAPIAFEWDMGDGSPVITDTNVVYNYATSGSYTITLITYDPTGCSNPDTTQQNVVIPPPVNIDAGFVTQQVPDCDDLIVTATDTTLNGSPTYQWNMGDGSPVLTTQNVTHTYTSAGTYTITMIAVDSATCNIADTATANISVAPPDTIIADFTISPQFDCNLLIAATNNLSTGDNLLFTWTMGDGTTLTDTNVVHTYTTAGTYDVTLVVQDALGCYPASSMTQQVTLNDLAPVVADMTVDQVSNCTLLQIDGTNLSSGDSVSYTWTLGDGTVLNTTDLTYQYTTAGTYTVQLLVTDLSGCNPPDSISTSVSMIDQLPVAISSTAVICPGETITLDGTWAGATSYTWNTGDTGPAINVSVGGVYFVNITDSLCNGSDTITVSEAPEHDLYYEFESCPNESNTLSVPLGNALSYSWFNGDSTQETDVYGPGTYTYDLIDADGCPHTDSVTVIPLDESALMFAPNAFTPDGDGINDVFVIPGVGERDFEVTIWNRWGHLLHTSTTKGAVWDGRYEGQIVQNGVYVYRLKYASFCQEGEVEEYYGHVTVVR